MPLAGHGQRGQRGEASPAVEPVGCLAPLKKRRRCGGPRRAQAGPVGRQGSMSTSIWIIHAPVRTIQSMRGVQENKSVRRMRWGCIGQRLGLGQCAMDRGPSPRTLPPPSSYKVPPCLGSSRFRAWPVQVIGDHFASLQHRSDRVSDGFAHPRPDPRKGQRMRRGCSSTPSDMRVS